MTTSTTPAPATAAPVTTPTAPARPVCGAGRAVLGLGGRTRRCRRTHSRLAGLDSRNHSFRGCGSCTGPPRPGPDRRPADHCPGLWPRPRSADAREPVGRPSRADRGRGRPHWRPRPEHSGHVRSAPRRRPSRGWHPPPRRPGADGGPASRARVRIVATPRAQEDVPTSIGTGTPAVLISTSVDEVSGNTVANVAVPAPQAASLAALAATGRAALVLDADEATR